MPIKSFEDLDVYKLAIELNNKIWEICIKWDNFAKFSVGNQIVQSSDSVSSNIAEGYGRYYFKENIKFCYYSRGSLLETIDWLNKSIKRKLITKIQYNELIKLCKKIHPKLNSYINYLKKQI